MADPSRLQTLFHRDPTRGLEEVQKVNSTAQAEQDVEEFCETESARRVLTRLGDVLKQDGRLPDPRFLYLHATFGSGKTHLLKLIGYATGQTGVSDSVVDGLSTRFDGFRHLRNAIEKAPVDRFVPVFLNLLDRDASAEPPIPVLIYEAIGNQLGYPTDPRWLLEFLFQLEQEAPETGLWPRLQETEVDGRSLLDDRGLMKTWLYEAVPRVLKEAGRDCTESDVRGWVEAAEEGAAGDAFGPEALRRRIKTAQSLLSDRSGEDTELLIGLDEIALFIGDERSRYEELRATMEVLIEDPNPVVLGTGQWGLKGVHADYVGDPDPSAWYSQEVGLEGADTEVIVRRRWLQKKSGAKPEVRQAIQPMPDPPEAFPDGTGANGFGAGGTGAEEDAVAAYPLRPGDLHAVREAMQALLTTGRGAATEHIQGRALLVLVRALFVRRGWAEEELGAIVPWPEFFAVLRSETNLVPTWTEELLSRLEANASGIEAPVQEVAQTTFLLNQAEIQATKAAITHLLLQRASEDVSERREDVREALGWLNENNYVFEESGEDPTWYRLLTERQVSVAEKVVQKAKTISYPRLRSTIKGWIREYGTLLKAPGNRQEVDLPGERKLPLTFHYSVLEPVSEPPDHPGAVALRVLVAGDTGTEAQDWKSRNDGGQASEDGLIAVGLPANFEDRLRRYIATGDVLQNETRHFSDLESDHLREEQVLREQLREALDEGEVMGARSGQTFGTYADGLKAFITEEVVPRKFPRRKSLTRALAPIDDGPNFAAFFHEGAEWPLSGADAQTLGVDLESQEFEEEGSWKQEFWAAAEARSGGKIIDGDQVIAMTEQRGGAFLGTSVEAMGALLLALATSEAIQLKQNGETLRDDKDRGRAVRNKTEIRGLTIRLEPPPGQEKVKRLRAVHGALTRADTTPKGRDEVAEAVTTWAQENAGEVQRIRQFIEQTFDRTAVGTLTTRLQEAASDPSSVDADMLSTTEMKEQAETYERARRLMDGDASSLWEKFLGERSALKDADLWTEFLAAQADCEDSNAEEPITWAIEDASTEEGVPTPAKIQDLLNDIKKFREPSTGGEECLENGGDNGNGNGPIGEGGLSEDEEERLEALKGQLNEEAEGRIVVIREGT